VEDSFLVVGIKLLLEYWYCELCTSTDFQIELILVLIFV
jgi:hypothetical protein